MAPLLNSSESLNRRRFLRLTLGAAIIGTAAGLPIEGAPEQGPSAARLPRWRGFNLLEKFNGNRNQPYREQDFRWMADWGFDFARLPMSYRCWARPDNWQRIDEKVIAEIDQAIEYGRRHKVHVNLNLHRIPGYCVNPPEEPLNLWQDEKALEAAAYHWQYFARRYKGISNRQLSFDLINEPAGVQEPDYVRVIRRIVDGIRAEDPQRLIVADGLQYGTLPVFGLADLKVAQSTRGYNPMQVSHYKASWVKGITEWPQPQWPMTINGKTWDKAALKQAYIEPWQQLAGQGVGIHVGEWGAFSYTPHSLALAWMKDCLELWKEAGWGWSLWNLRGAFGILDSDRQDVAYEDFQGHRLDRQMLNLLQQH